jgi:hypothetical protein
MVNRHSNFNRRKVKKVNLIRTNKRATARNKRNAFEKVEAERELTKKEMKRQKRLDKIYDNLGVKESEIVHKKILKRRNHKKKRQANEKMDVE